jgi:hypothetical protein
MMQAFLVVPAPAADGRLRGQARGAEDDRKPAFQLRTLALLIGISLLTWLAVELI